MAGLITHNTEQTFRFWVPLFKKRFLCCLSVSLFIHVCVEYSSDCNNTISPSGAPAVGDSWLDGALSMANWKRPRYVFHSLSNSSGRPVGDCFLSFDLSPPVHHWEQRKWYRELRLLLLNRKIHYLQLHKKCLCINHVVFECALEVIIHVFTFYSMLAWLAVISCHKYTLSYLIYSHFIFLAAWFKWETICK